MPLPKAILFDADGTLYESEHLNFEANRRTAKELHDFTYVWGDYDKHVRRGKRSGYMVLEDNGIVVEPEAYIARKQVHFEELVNDQLVLHPGVVMFLKWCHDNDIINVIVSATRRPLLEVALIKTGIADYFKATVCMEDVGERGKPDPYPYILGLERAGVAAEKAIAVEDTAKGIASAQAAGLYTIGIYNVDNSAKDLASADYQIHQYDELRAHLMAQN